MIYENIKNAKQQITWEFYIELPQKLEVIIKKRIEIKVLESDSLLRKVDFAMPFTGTQRPRNIKKYLDEFWFRGKES